MSLENVNSFNDYFVFFFESFNNFKSFKVLLENGNEVIAYISGKMRKNKIKVVVGDTVTVEVGIADLTKGIIKHRHNPPKSFS